MSENLDPLLPITQIWILSSLLTRLHLFSVSLTTASLYMLNTKKSYKYKHCELASMKTQRGMAAPQHVLDTLQTIHTPSC